MSDFTTQKCGQKRPRSDRSSKNCLIWVWTFCIYMYVWKHRMNTIRITKLSITWVSYNGLNETTHEKWYFSHVRKGRLSGDWPPKQSFQSLYFSYTSIIECVYRWRKVSLSCVLAQKIWYVFIYWCVLDKEIQSLVILSSIYPVSILHKSISGRHRPVRVADGPMTARCRFT